MRISDWSSDVCSSDLHGDRGQTLVTPDAVIEMDDEIARRNRRLFGQKRIGGFAAPGAAPEEVAEHVLFCEEGDIGAREPVLERQHDQRHVRFGLAERYLAGLGLLPVPEAVSQDEHTSELQ